MFQEVANLKILRDAGAKEIHMRVSSPPFLHPCFFGTDIRSRELLIACKMPLEDICGAIGADSLGYLSIEGARRMAEHAHIGFCDACFTGNYPIEVPDSLPVDKFSQKIVGGTGK